MVTSKELQVLIKYREELMKKTIAQLKQLLDKNAKEYLEASRIPRYTKKLYINALVYAKCRNNNFGLFSKCIDLSYTISQSIQ